MKSLHIEMGKNLLGGTMQTLYLTNSLAEQKHETHLVCSHNSELKNKFAGSDVIVHPVLYCGDLDFSLLFRIYFIAKKIKPDVIHIHSRRGADTLGLLGSYLSNTGKIVLSRRVDDPLKLNFFNKLRFEVLPDAVVTVSKGIQNVIMKAGLKPKKLRQVYSSIEFSKYDSALTKDEAKQQFNFKKDFYYLIVVAQLIPRKGHQFLIDALPLITEKIGNVHLVFVGKGEYYDFLNEYCKAKQVENSVHFLGFRDDIADLLRASDILVHPATMEGFANVVLQAMASGIPVVSTDVGGMPESVRDNINGLLVKPKDPSGLAEAIITLLSNEKLRYEFGLAGKNIVRNEFTVQSMVNGNLNIYKELLGDLT